MSGALLQPASWRAYTSCAGIGLHSGNKVTLTLKPAAADAGIIFRRTDLGIEIPATVKHALDEARASGADFVIFGPIFETPSKVAYGAPQGVEALGSIVANTRVPVLAIGGIDATNVAAVRAAGAHGVAVIRAILGATDPAAATRTLLAALH